MVKSSVRVVLVLAALGTCPLAVLADEIVHFTNGAEMTVRAHTVEKEKDMLRLDLGGNNFIAFPMSMVDKIVNAGQDVYLNPVFHPANQAIAGSPIVADTTIRGSGAPVGFVHQANDKGNAGMMLGEAADALPASSKGGPQLDQALANSRRRFNPLNQPGPGSAPQVIMPPKMAKAATQLVVIPPPPPETPPPSEPVPEDNPDNP